MPNKNEVEQLKESVRAKVCATCPYRTHGTDGCDLKTARPCEADCPVFHALPVLNNVARQLDPLVSNRPKVIDDMLHQISAADTHSARIVRLHADKIRQAVLEHFHD